VEGSLERLRVREQGLLERLRTPGDLGEYPSSLIALSQQRRLKGPSKEVVQPSKLVDLCVPDVRARLRLPAHLAGKLDRVTPRNRVRTPKTGRQNKHNHGNCQAASCL
jgi:hypothetical protein